MSDQPLQAIAAEPQIQVLYDGGCPLCRREIAHYQRLRPRRALHWVDIDADRQAPEHHGLRWRDAMARFHVIEGEAIHSGASAFLVLWTAMPGWRHLATTIRGLKLEPVIERGYVGTGSALFLINRLVTYFKPLILRDFEVP